jgi:putative transposase
MSVDDEHSMYNNLYMQNFICRTNRLQVPGIYEGGQYYFVTILVKERACIFDVLESSIHVYTKSGDTVVTVTFSTIVADCLLELETVFEGLSVHDWVIMPNHIHTILSLTSNSKSKTTNKNINLGGVIKSFKAQAQKRIVTATTVSPHLTKTLPYGFNYHKLWHKSYHDHIIRDEAELFGIRKYIQDNPMSWELDEFNLKKGDAL